MVLLIVWLKNKAKVLVTCVDNYNRGKKNTGKYRMMEMMMLIGIGIVIFGGPIVLFAPKDLF